MENAEIRLPKYIVDIARDLYPDRHDPNRFHMYRTKYVPNDYLLNNYKKLVEWFGKKCLPIAYSPSFANLPSDLRIVGNEKKFSFMLRLPDEYRQALVACCPQRINQRREGPMR